MRFSLTINLGNDAMNDPISLSDALRGVARDLRSSIDLAAQVNTIRDFNGNSVGTWSLTESRTRSSERAGAARSRSGNRY